MSAPCLVSCRVGSEQYAVRDTDVREIARSERLRRDPRGDGAVGTLLLDGGERVAVFALAEVLRPGSSAAAATSAWSHVVVTRGPTAPIGWLVERVARLPPIDGLAVRPLPLTIGWPATRWFEGLSLVDDQPMLVVSPSDLDPRVQVPAKAASPPIACGLAAGPMEPLAATPPLVLTFSTPALSDAGLDRWVVSARRVVAIVSALTLTPVPGSAPHVVGISMCYGQVTPVIDLGGRGAPVDGGRFLVVRCADGTTVAFPIGNDTSLRYAAADARAIASESQTAPACAGVFDLEGTHHALLDPDRLAAV